MSDNKQRDNTTSHSTTTVNFYILADSDADNRLSFVYRLVEKAFDQQLKTLIITANDTQLAHLNRLIWAAKPTRFIPHEIIDETLTAPLPPVLLSCSLTPLTTLGFSPEVVIDLSYDGEPLNFSKIMLVANQHQEILANARMKYQSYVNAGIKPHVYKLPSQG